LVSAADFVAVLDSGSLSTNDDRLKTEHVVVSGGSQILAADFGNDEQDSGVFQVPVTMAGGPQELDTANLKEIDVIRVVDAPLSVGFLVTDANRYLVLAKRN
jgi:hypothetical protein